MQTYRAREAAARDRRIREAERLAAERLKQNHAAARSGADESARRPSAEAREARGTAPGGRTALQRFRDAAGMNTCSLDIQTAQRVLFGDGIMLRWTTTELAARFPRQREAGGVTTYVGDAIQFRDPDGAWLNAVYECDYDHDAGEVADMRVELGRLR